MGNPLIWVMCTGALCAAILGNELTSFLCFIAALLTALLGNIATVWLALRKAKQTRLNQQARAAKIRERG